MAKRSTLANGYAEASLDAGRCVEPAVSIEVDESRAVVAGRLFASWATDAPSSSDASASNEQHADGPDEDELVVLLRRAKANDAAAVSDLVMRARRGVRGFIEGRTRNWPDSTAAEDVAQEAELRLVTYLPNCRAQTNGQFVSWMLTVTRSALTDYYRANIADLAEGMLREELGDTIAESASEVWVDADETTLSRGAVELVAATMASYAVLPDELAELLYEKVIGTASWGDIAKRFGTTAAGAKRRYQRAQRKLRSAVVGHIARLVPEHREVTERELRRYNSGITRRPCVRNRPWRRFCKHPSRTRPSVLPRT